MGALFGEMENCDSNFENIKVLSDVNFITYGSGSQDLHVGLIGILFDGARNTPMHNIDFSNIKVLYTINSSGDNINFGGILGYASQIYAKNIKGPKETSFKPNTDSKREKGTYSVGGIVGTIGFKGTKASSQLGDAISGNVYCKIDAEQSNAYVGGMIGRGYNAMIIGKSDSQGDVIAISSATSGKKYNVKDARTMAYSDVCQLEADHVYRGYNKSHKGRYITGIYQDYLVAIPLAVGGVFGYTNTISQNVEKKKGSVRALLTNLTSDYITYLNPAHNYENGNYPEYKYVNAVNNYIGHTGTNYQPYYHEDYIGSLRNNETTQCRAGAYAGLVENSAVWGFNATETVSIYGDKSQARFPSINNDNEKSSILGIGIYNSKYDPKGEDKYAFLGYINVYEKNLSIKTYKVTNCSLPVSYGNNKYKYNYNLLRNQTASDVLSQSDYNESNIFGYTNQDYIVDLYENNFTFKDITSIAENISSYRDTYIYNRRILTSRLTYCNDLDSLEITGCSVFAGFKYDNITYNRSYWSMPIEKIGDRYTDDRSTAYSKNIHYYDGIESCEFLIAPHWAGESIGGVIS
ncbi:MAG TPA: hypothetical protein DCZ34_00250 [Clostridiales bacterium]|nr:hypothetical protein [Clostridiales bacterium]